MKEKLPRHVAGEPRLAILADEEDRRRPGPPARVYPNVRKRLLIRELFGVSGRGDARPGHRAGVTVHRVLAGQESQIGQKTAGLNRRSWLEDRHALDGRSATRAWA